MDIEQRVTILENMIYALINKTNTDKYYAKTDTIGVQKSVNDITPYTETKTAYIGDTSATFSNRPGNLTVYFPHPYTVERLTDRIIISFDELEEVTDITISIL